MENCFLTLGFRYFEFLFIYERIWNQIRIRIFGIFVLALNSTSLDSGFYTQWALSSENEALVVYLQLI